LIACELGLAADGFEVTFQSRLGRSPWIRPYTDIRVRELAKSGVKRLAALSPSFTADCLETLEEIGLRGAEDFRAHGGEALRLVPSLNSEDLWARAVMRIMRDAAMTPVVAGGNQGNRILT
jgi:ferrochelatase